MPYKNLSHLLLSSSSSRNYFFSLPGEVQLILRDQNEFIHTLFELRRNAEHILKQK